LARLCQSYWYPLYFYVRRLSHGPEDAQDIVQGFFAQLLEKQYVGDVDPKKGKFRSFLLVALKRFMANQWDRANRQKRGGGQQFVFLDAENVETSYSVEPADRSTPERAYEKRWAMLLLARVLDRLEEECSAAGKARVFEELRVFLTGDKTERTYAEIGQRIGMSEANLKVTVHRLRQRYRELLREEIAVTVDSPEAIDEEIRNLYLALSE
jgi:RNA polymerase sigma factor (sigma-70 family)